MSDQQATSQPSAPAVVNPPSSLRDVVDLRCPSCNRLTEWPSAFVAANHGASVACQLCGQTMLIP